MRDPIKRFKNRSVVRSDRNFGAKCWLLTRAITSTNVGYRLGGALALGHITPYGMAILMLLAVYATAAFAVAWFSLHVGSRTLIQNCSFVGQGLTLKPDGLTIADSQTAIHIIKDPA